MKLELKINGRRATVKKIKQAGSILTVSVDDKIYEVDLYKVSPVEYSIINKGTSYNVEVIESMDKNLFNVNTFFNEYDIEVIDERRKHSAFRSQSELENSSNSVLSPMPGKVVKVLVNPGDKVVAGQTIIVLSAMKMENEFKAGRDGTVSKVPVKEGDVVDTHQLLVSFKPEK